MKGKSIIIFLKKNKFYTISFLAALLLCLINFWITVWYYELMQEQLGLSEIENNKSYNKYFSKKGTVGQKILKSPGQKNS